MQYFHSDQAVGTPPAELATFDEKAAQASLHFHRTIPHYAPTPLVSLPHLAQRLGVAALHVKDESSRFGLNSFKGLGGSWCVANVMSQRLGMDPAHPDFVQLTQESKRQGGGLLTFCTATDDNHGLGIAWSARAMGQHCVVWLPAGSSAERVEKIRAMGAQVHVSDVNYDQTVEKARALSRENGWTFVQDTDDEKSSAMVQFLMQGYLTLGLETAQELQKQPPTHVFLQAGVGSFAGAMAAFFSNVWKDTPPTFVVVEAKNVACIMKTAIANDGEIHSVGGDSSTIMAGLSCGTPCRYGWKILHHLVRHFVAIDDVTAARAMRVLGNPLAGDTRIVSGESGASGVGAFIELMQDPNCAAIRKAIGLNEHSRVLAISTEGDTDKENYRRIVWDGAWS